MTKDETILLRKEVERLNRIIDIILDKNKQLELALAAYKFAPGGQMPLDYSKQSQENAQIHIGNSNHDVENGINNTVYSNCENMNGINTVDNSNHSSMNGIIKLDVSNDNIMNGISNIDYSNDNAVNGINIKDNSNHKNKIGISSSTGNTGENKVGINMDQVNAAIGALKQVMHKTSDKSIRNTAIILLQLRQQPVNSLLSLRQLTHLSAGGIAKRIMALKKYGYITRTGFQQYGLTDKSLQIIERSGEVNFHDV